MKERTMRELIGTSGVFHTDLRGDAIIFPEDLESLDKQVYEELLQNLVARQVVTLKTDDPPGAETVTYEFYTLAGDSDKAVYNWGAGGDIPLADANVIRVPQRVLSLVYGITINPQELRAARLVGKPIESIKARAAGYFIAKKENDLFFVGDAATGHYGIFTHPNVTRVAIPNGGWATATGDKILEDIRALRAAINRYDGIEARAVVFPKSVQEYLEKFVSDTYPVRTVMEAIKAYNWFPGGIFFSQSVPPGKFAVLDNSPRVVQLSVPMNVTRLEPVVITPNNTYQVNYEERCAGAIIRYPQGIAINDDTKSI
jgi:hypothetical protein